MNAVLLLERMDLTTKLYVVQCSTSIQIRTHLVAHPLDEESGNGAEAPDVPYCACCYSIDDFPGVPFKQAYPMPSDDPPVGSARLKTPAPTGPR